MTGKRYLIVNADDFGLSRGVNRGIVKAYENGIVTSASLMVRSSAASEAAAYGRKNPGLCLGLHFDLGEWVYRDGHWVPLYEVVPIKDNRAVEVEAYRQLDAFRRILGQDPTHMDSHQHIHLREPVNSIIFEIALKVGVPLRHRSEEICYRGDFYGQTDDGKPNSAGIDADRLLQILENLTPGITELSCHPAEGDDIITMYRKEREIELVTLCNPRIRSAIKNINIELCSFKDIAGISSGANRGY
ncbi:MAG: hypothetical protein A2W09_07435 [Deltaproteobacteria bacterium RBG_16_50_11]|nr:MAG: hypothetical protein A2W09_07435 [Deltaproteobacteria bacterium RBG_16_50_11]